MKAPERIYVEVCEDGIFAFPEPPFAESVEYVRANVVRQSASDALEDEAVSYCFDNGINLSPRQAADFARHFAEWQKSKMLEEAVEGKVFMSFVPGHNQMVMADVDLPTNTKVKIIIVKEDEI